MLIVPVPVLEAKTVWIVGETDRDRDLHAFLLTIGREAGENYSITRGESLTLYLLANAPSTEAV